MGQYYSSELPTALEAARVSSQVIEKKQQAVIDRCARKINRAKIGGETCIYEHDHLTAQSVARLTSMGYTVKWIVPEDYRAPNFYSIGWETPAVKSRTEK